MTDPSSIRRFEPRDEAGVRRICADTALLGEPIAPVFDDLELVADVLIACYYRIEPQSFFVAAPNDQVTGYLSGCLDTAAFMSACRKRVVRVLIEALFTRGLLFHPACWRFARFAVAYGRAVTALRASVAADYPAHLHINLAAAARGHGTGMALMNVFLDYAAKNGARGVHLTTPSPAASRFFMKAGFRLVTEQIVHGFHPRDLRPISLLVKDLL
jgi:GNAT superfamily N-acetyltransferase